MTEEKEKCCKELKLSELIGKTNLANIAAFGIVIVVLCYAIYKGEMSLTDTLLGAGITWLFKANGN